MKDGDCSALIAKLREDGLFVLLAKAVTVALEEVLTQSRPTAAAAAADSVTAVTAVACLKRFAASRRAADLEAAVAVPPREAS
jgi:hypothetical protein